MSLPRKSLDRIVSMISYLKKSRRVKIRRKPTKVNLGSGLSVYPGWINIDSNLSILFRNYPKFVLKYIYKISSWKRWLTIEEYLNILKKNEFIHHDLRYGLPLEKNSVDYIYSSHTLEHFFRRDALSLLKESNRVLKENGIIIRICVPDLEHAFKLYKSGKEKESLHFFFVQDPSELEGYHKYMYNFKLMKEILEEAGFKNVKKYSYQKGEMPDLNGLDKKPEQTLYVEAVKLNYSSK